MFIITVVNAMFSSGLKLTKVINLFLYPDHFRRQVRSEEMSAYKYMKIFCIYKTSMSGLLSYVQDFSVAVFHPVRSYLQFTCTVLSSLLLLIINQDICPMIMLTFIVHPKKSKQCF